MCEVCVLYYSLVSLLCLIFTLCSYPQYYYYYCYFCYYQVHCTLYLIIIAKISEFMVGILSKCRKLAGQIEIEKNGI